MNSPHIKSIPFQKRGISSDVLLGARISILDHECDHSWHEGVVVAVEPMCGPSGDGECLRMMVQKRVIANVESPMNERMLVIDTNISMQRIKIDGVNGVARRA